MAQASFMLAYALLWQQARHSPQRFSVEPSLFVNHTVRSLVYIQLLT